MNYYINDIGVHFLGGIGFSGIDRLFSRDSKRHTEQRVKDKIFEVDALRYLKKHNAETDKSDEQYMNAVDKVREYFERTRVYTPKKSFLEKAVETVKSLRTSANERLNNLPAGKTLAFAYIAELTGDVGIFISSMTTGVGNGVVAVAETSYEGAAAFLGLQTGKGLLYIKDYCLRSRDEKDLDKIAKELTADGKLLEIVRNYSPTARVELTPEMIEANVLSADDTASKTSESKTKSAADYGAEVGEKLADLVEGAGDAVSSTVDAFKKKFEERSEEANASDKKRREEFEQRMKKY